MSYDLGFKTPLLKKHYLASYLREQILIFIPFVQLLLNNSPCELVNSIGFRHIPNKVPSPQEVSGIITKGSSVCILLQLCKVCSPLRTFIRYSFKSRAIFCCNRLKD
jgi:hypothetical protein